MSSITVTISSNYGLVLLVASATYILTMYQSTMVGIWRAKAGIKYPQTHAEVSEMQAKSEAKIFNCAQRAHMNTMDALPNMMFALLTGGIRFPKICAFLGAVWIFGRVLYTRSYLSGEPDQRNSGGGGPIHFFSGLGLQVMAFISGIQLFLGFW